MNFKTLSNKRHHMKFHSIIFAVSIILLTASAKAATVIDTTLSWDGVQGTGDFGESSIATFGQSFFVETDTRLDYFTFSIDDFVNPDNVDFEVYVMEWDGVKATGPTLFKTEPMLTTNNGGLDGYESFTINTGGLSLASGSQYVAFLTSSNLFDGEIGTSLLASVDDAYGRGTLVLMDNGVDFSMLTTENWARFENLDLAFTMGFNTSPVPVPAAVWLFSSGLIGLLGIARRRQ